MNHQLTAESTSRISSQTVEEQPDHPLAGVPFFSKAPLFGRMLSRCLIVGWIILAIFVFGQVCDLLFNKWLLESVDLGSVFWTNFGMGAKLFAVAFLVFTAAVAVPAIVTPISKRARANLIQLAVMVGIVVGYLICLSYREFLLLGHGQSFGKTDPVFNNDLSLYVFRLPAYWTMITAAIWCAAIGVATSVMCALIGKSSNSGRASRGLFARIATPSTIATVGILGVLSAAALWLCRYDLLLRDNYDSTIHNGAQYVDVNGFFSTLMDYNITALVALGITAAVVFLLVSRRMSGSGDRAINLAKRVRWGITAIVALFLLDFAFKAGVMIRDTIFVDPNEPVIQLDYIQHHLDATLDGYDLADIDEVRFIPRDGEDPMPSADELLASPTIKNVPLWPGFENYIEPVVDPQHAERIVITDGDDMVYGPTLEVFQQQEKLRAYYKFLTTDSVRYKIDGQKQMLVSSVRELPVNEPYPWLATWGQRHVLFTHGHGLVMASASDVTSDGTPVYKSKGIPAHTDSPELYVENPAVYYGEGSAIWAFSNVRKMKELDYPTDEGRAEIVLPEDIPSGVHVDSLLKRIVIGWNSGQFFELVFSRLIGEETRVHYNRMPTERLNRIAPFLFLDHNAYAVAAENRMLWMVNGMTTTDQYPYSRLRELGDKSVQRSPYWVRQPFKTINYVRDAVKATVDAQTGAVRLYKIADEPIINTWASIYPDMFLERKDMPEDVASHLQYPLQMFHIQFDDIYNEYHMKDAIYFFNWEDGWDDGDEVQGPILDQGKSITFSMEPANWIVEADGTLLPKSDDGTQFVMSMPFTSEGAKNIRAVPMVYQDGDDYGRLVCLRVPKAHFYLGPEQADSAIDQEPEISEQISWWNRRGTDVIRGHTSMLIVKGEVIYVEPIFIRSQQNPVTQMKKVIVVFRGKAQMGDTFEEALRRAIAAAERAGTESVAGAE